MNEPVVITLVEPCALRIKEGVQGLEGAHQDHCVGDLSYQSGLRTLKNIEELFRLKHS